MAEYKNGVSALGNVSVSKEDTAAEVQTGRAVFVDEDKYENDAAYKAKVDKCAEEGFHKVSEGESANSGGGTEPLIVSFDHMEQQAGQGTKFFYDKTWQEIADALTANRPVYAKYGIINEDDASYEEDNASLVPIYRAYTQTSGGNTSYLAATIDVDAAFSETGFYALSANGQISAFRPLS